MLYRGNEERSSLRGTAFMINATESKNLFAFEPTAERMCKYRLKGRFRNDFCLCFYQGTPGKKNIFGFECFVNILFSGYII